VVRIVGGRVVGSLADGPRARCQTAAAAARCKPEPLMSITTPTSISPPDGPDGRTDLEAWGLRNSPGPWKSHGRQLDRPDGPGTDAPRTLPIGVTSYRAKAFTLSSNALVREELQWSQVRRGGEAAAERRYRQVAAQLRRAVWDPVADRPGNAPRAFVVPDGQLGLVNIHGLLAMGD
jgi:hypothetical protein